MNLARKFCEALPWLGGGYSPSFPAEARIRSEVSSLGFVVEKVALGYEFLLILRHLPLSVIPPTHHTCIFICPRPYVLCSRQRC